MYTFLCLDFEKDLILFLCVTTKKRCIVANTMQDNIIISDEDRDASGEDDADEEQTSATCAYVSRKA